MRSPSLSTSARPYLIFGQPDIRQEDIDEVLDSLRSGWLGTGPKVQAFERAIARYVGMEHAVATNSCTAALHLALLSLGIEPGDEVIVPTLTFCATANVVLHAGARPVLVDVDHTSQCLTAEAVEAAITPRTKAVIPVHFAGWPVDMSTLRCVADRHGLKIIQDAAHCVEGLIDGVPTSRYGDVTCFSFYTTKNVVTGEGGMAVTNDPALADRMRVLGLHGIDADAWKRFTSRGYRHYSCVAPGFKYNMMDLQAALGLHQLARVDQNLRLREAQWTRYQDALQCLPLELPATAPPNVRHAHHLYTVRVRPDAPLTRDELIWQLHERGIGTGVHYVPVHEHPYYRELLGSGDGLHPVASRIGRCTCSLPLGPGLSEDEQSRVIAALHEVLGGVAHGDVPPLTRRRLTAPLACAGPEQPR
jgi:dTDP-4-amino-4,6-dideoxygalactose transaminase